MNLDPCFKTAPPWLKERLLVLHKSGSHSYGLNTPTSDLDVRGICTEPPEVVVGFAQNFNQFQNHSDLADLTVFGLRKFCKLAAQCNPNIIESLWVRPDEILERTDAYDVLRARRHLFLTQKARHTFRGYAMSQLKRIKTHRRWLENPQESPPERKDFGLPETTLIPRDQLNAAIAAIQKQLDTWELDFSGVPQPTILHVQEQIAAFLADISVGQQERFRIAGEKLGYDTNFLEHLEREKRYKSARNEYRQYQTWKKERNPKRAAMEAEHGYDLKHAMHLVRLMRMGEEILLRGEVKVFREDRDELLAIRSGAWSLDHLVAWAEETDAFLKGCKSDLPWGPDLKAIDQMCRELTFESWGIHYG